MILEYAVQVILFQLAFLLVYDLLLKKETCFSYNRWYLIATPALALLLPLLKIKFLTRAVPPATFKNFNWILLPEVVIGGNQNEAITTTVVNDPNSFNWWLLTYLAGVIISMVLLILKFRKLQSLTKASVIIKEWNVRIYQVKNSNVACTFFDRLFIGDRISEEEKVQIIAHEMVHIKEKHSLDLIFFEILKVILWFNPLIYLFQNRLATVHEFIADETAVKVSGKRTYYEQLLNSAFGTQNISFINQFFSHSLIKKRIIMLQKHKSSTISKFKFLLILPLMLAMLTYVACSKEGTATIEEKPVTLEEKLAELNAYLENKDSLTDKEKAQYLKLLKTREKLLLNGKNGDNIKTIEVIEDSPRAVNENVPFAVIDQVPVFLGCKDLTSNEAQKKCMSTKIAEFVNANFDTSLGKKLGLTGINRVIVQFRIDKTGKIVDIKSRGPRPELEEEAKRVISNLPQMEPGQQNGKNVSVMYSLPIAFQVSE